MYNDLKRLLEAAESIGTVISVWMMQILDGDISDEITIKGKNQDGHKYILRFEYVDEPEESA